MEEFDWLGGCVACNKGCCHNTDRNIPPNECVRVKAPEDRYTNMRLSISDTNDIADKVTNTPDNRPLECRLFPFDIKNVEGKPSWIIYKNCNESSRLNYEKALDFLERKFFREIPVEQVRQYADDMTRIPLNSHQGQGHSPVTEYKVIREIRWPLGYDKFT